MLSTLFCKKTNYVAGDLIREYLPLSGPKTLTAHPKFIAPRKIDNRDMCLSSSNQGQTPHCAGYSTAGYIEYKNWKALHYPKQVNGDKIYAEAKKFDGSTAEGTTLSAAAKGAISLGLITGKGRHVPPTRNNIKYALHEHGICTVGFAITNEWNYVDAKGRIANLGSKAKAIGGHAVLLCGYNDEGVYIQNSWGPNWGKHGFALLRWKQFDKQLMLGLVIVEK